MGVNKGFEKNELPELIFWETVDLPREVNQVVFCFSKLNVSQGLMYICISKGLCRTAFLMPFPNSQG